jgi:hypothetical protein
VDPLPGHAWRDAISQLWLIEQHVADFHFWLPFIWFKTYTDPQLI